MDLKQYLKDNILYLDGGTGTLLQEHGLPAGEGSERWNLSHPEIISGIARSYFDAGSNVVLSNTFSANALKYGENELDAIISAALDCANRGREESSGKQEKYVALDIGPLGKLLAPFGELDFELAADIFARAVRAGVRAGAQLIMIETMNDAYETKAALLAAKENSSLPVFVSNAYGENGRLLTGAPPEAMVCLAESMGADAVGVNCAFGPERSLEIARRLVENTCLPVIMKPNAGMPEFVGGKTVYTCSPESFADTALRAAEAGVRILGGCCGTTPRHIARLAEKTAGAYLYKKPIGRKTRVSSYARCVTLGDKPVLIGERINPTGKKRFKSALLGNDIEYILGEGLEQKRKGADILDVNVGLPGTDEAVMLKRITERLQAVCDLPLQLDSSDVTALEAAMRIYNGKPLINSVSGKKEVTDKVFPLVKKYGGAVIALTLDENGIPESVDGRVRIALGIIEKAKKFGIDKSDIIFDPLALTVSTDPDNARLALESIREIREKTGCCTVLGISNISFGLPAREKLNSAFLLLALNAGLPAAIADPCSEEINWAFRSYLALSGKDRGFEAFISHAGASGTERMAENRLLGTEEELFDAVFRGRGTAAAELTEKLLREKAPLDIINGCLIPALDKTGTEFEKKVFYLPQLLMSAEAAGAAFGVIRKAAANVRTAEKCSVVLASVKGDIHDIGKNIVRLLLENYGFNVVDLGKDVAPETVAAAVVGHGAPVAGLSALMTTTLPAMEETVAKIKSAAPFCRVVVGGAVVTRDFAERINADKYAADAMETVRYCTQVFNSLTRKQKNG